MRGARRRREVQTAADGGRASTFFEPRGHLSTLEVCLRLLDSLVPSTILWAIIAIILKMFRSGMLFVRDANKGSKKGVRVECVGILCVEK